VTFGGIAQLGEHLLCKQGVVGSIPSGSTNPRLGEGWGGCEGSPWFGQKKFLSLRMASYRAARLLFVIVRSVLSGFRVAGLEDDLSSERMSRNGYPYLCAWR
jgi:hypothetical protein